MADKIDAMNWDDAYRGEAGFDGPPPWNIGEPQPELAALIKAGKVRSDVLDAGCGHAELSLALAADGYTVVGIELTQTAVAAATKAAHVRDLPNATFVQDDITTFTGFDARFNTIIDSTLFHSLPVAARDAYQQSVYRAAAPGAAYYILVFAHGAFPAELETAPNAVTEDELRAAVGKYWQIDDVRPAFIHTHPMPMPMAPAPSPMSQAPFQMPDHESDDQGRMKLPAFLLSAHKAPPNNT